MKWFNWGVGIALFYGLFMVAMVAVVLRTTQFDHALVSEKYYADDLRYQEHYDKLLNTRGLKAKPEIEFNDDRSGIRLAFPPELGEVEGEVTFFRPSNQSSDFQVPLTLGENRLLFIPTQDLDPGLWKVQLDWSADDKAYYLEKVIVL